MKKQALISFLIKQSHDFHEKGNNGDIYSLGCADTFLVVAELLQKLVVEE